MPGPRRNGPAHILVVKRRAFCVELLNRGATYEEIAEHVRTTDAEFQRPKFTRADAYNDCKAVIQEITQKPARMYRAGQNIDIMKLKRIYRPKAQRGDLKAAQLMLKLMEREAKLNGFDAPTRTTIEITQHFDALAQLATAAVHAALNALPELTAEQRSRALSGCRASLLALESGEPGAGPGQLPAGQDDGIEDAEVVEDSLVG